MRRSGDFSTTIRRGVRRARPSVVVHFALPKSDAGSPDCPLTAPQVGLVVSKAVGNAVVRNQVKRRLRAIAAERVAALPPGCAVVIRATPASSQTSFTRLQRDLAGALDDAASRATRSSAR
jgi:ribonuclease P protein component